MVGVGGREASWALSIHLPPRRRGGLLPGRRRREAGPDHLELDDRARLESLSGERDVRGRTAFSGRPTCHEGHVTTTIAVSRMTLRPAAEIALSAAPGRPGRAARSEPRSAEIAHDRDENIGDPGRRDRRGDRLPAVPDGSPASDELRGRGAGTDRPRSGDMRRVVILAPQERPACAASPGLEPDSQTRGTSKRARGFRLGPAAPLRRAHRPRVSS